MRTDERRLILAEICFCNIHNKINRTKTWKDGDVTMIITMRII